jgi:AAA+ superfamily predicted ATPase
MPGDATFDELQLLVRARYALIVLDTVEVERAEEGLALTASRLNLLYFSWSRSRGLRRGALPSDPTVDQTDDPALALAQIREEGAGLFHFRGLSAHLDDPAVVSHVLDVVQQFNARRGALVLTGHGIRLPDALRPHATVIRLAGATFDDYRQLLERLIREYSARMPVKIELTAADRLRLVNNLTGLTLNEAEKIITKLIVDDGALRPHDIERVNAAKRQIVEQDGLLEFHPQSEGLDQVAGLGGLKQWLARRRAVVAEPQRAQAFGLSFPKGVLLLGVPGCGKSLCAKSVAHEWGLPLLKLDPSNLYDKFVGESEHNFKRAMLTAERLAPIVLWIDELEKAFASASADADGGVSHRIFGTFLSWLQERKGDVFVVATSNDVAKLPPEFIRKGRFDEIFFVDLPGEGARAEILRIHLSKRKQDPLLIDLPRVVAATTGFSGAEIEESIVSAMYAVFSAGTSLTTETLLAEVAATRPLSTTMPERLDALRRWATQRTVAAD